MKVQAQETALISANSQRVAAERSVQQVFSNILASVGRDGFASADPAADTDVTADQITDSWQEWLNVSGYARYTTVDSAQSTLNDFGALLVQAHDAGAYAAPQAYLSGLDSDQLQTLQQVHHLAQPINVGALSEEGALNLILPPPAQVDLNADGLTQSGIGNSIRFPDSRTPREVADAWEEATAGLSPTERMMRELQMKTDVLLANIHVDDQGRYVSRSEPGDADFVNPMAAAGYSYVNKARTVLESIESFKNQTPPQQYERDRDFWTSFATALESHGAR